MACHILVVSVDPEHAQAYETALVSSALGTVTVAHSFAAAKSILQTRPVDVLVTDLRLRDFNGLHLTIWARARNANVRAVVVGYPDTVVAHDLGVLGGTYVSSGVVEDIVDAVREGIERAQPRRRWSRHPVRADLFVSIDGTPARLVDVSCGGFRAETSAISAGPPAAVVVDIPQLALHEEATRLWVRPLGEGAFLCGVAVAEKHAHAGSRWRGLVSAMASPAPNSIV